MDKVAGFRQLIFPEKLQMSKLVHIIMLSDESRLCKAESFVGKPFEMMMMLYI